MNHIDLENVEEALLHLDKLNSHLLRGDVTDPLILDAVNMRLFAAIEALSRLPEELRQDLFGKEWHAMRSTRNRIAHSYLQTRQDIIAATVERDVPQMVALLRDIFESRSS